MCVGLSVVTFSKLPSPQSITVFTFPAIGNVASNTGNVVVAGKIADFIASDVLKITDSQSKWKSRYDALIAEELEKSGFSNQGPKL